MPFCILAEYFHLTYPAVLHIFHFSTSQLPVYPCCMHLKFLLAFQGSHQISPVDLFIFYQCTLSFCHILTKFPVSPWNIFSLLTILLPLTFLSCCFPPASPCTLVAPLQLTLLYHISYNVANSLKFLNLHIYFFIYYLSIFQYLFLFNFF